MAPGRLRCRENALLLSADGDGDDDSMLSTTASTRLLPSAVGANARDVARYVSFAVAILSCLCAGSVTAFSLYGHLFQEHLRYTQLQVNAVSIAAELASYLLVPLIGYLCDRAGPAKLSFAGAVLFGAGYLLAAFTYRSGTRELGETNGGRGLQFGLMIGAFAAIGAATSCLYLSAVTTCAKNFGRGRYKGVALACPIAAYGLSGMWLSQIGSRVLYEKNPDGTAGDVDVFKFFIFLAILLFLTGLSGAVGLRIVDENELIDEAFEELEASGLLEDSAPFQRNDNGSYGSFPVNQEQLANDNASVRDVDNKRKEQEEEEARKKTRLLNEETRMFLKDHTMWFLAAGFFFVTGPGEAYINNVGTIISTLYPPGTKPSTIPTTAASHISILAFTSTIARLFTGSLTDFLRPNPTNRLYKGPANNSIASLPSRRSRFAVSRIVFLIIFAIFLSLGQTLLASGLIENHGERFWIVSALIGSGYGAVFSLVPIIVAVIWGVENFGTNWGIVLIVPALGATLWGVAYSSIYQRAADHSAVGGIFSGGIDKISDNVLCYGKDCYASTFWAMAISVWIACVMWIQAWKGKGGWSERGIAV